MHMKEFFVQVESCGQHWGNSENCMFYKFRQMTTNVEQYKVIGGMMINLRTWSARYKRVITAGFRPIGIGEKIRLNNFNNNRVCGALETYRHFWKHLLFYPSVHYHSAIYQSQLRSLLWKNCLRFAGITVEKRTGCLQEALVNLTWCYGSEWYPR